jgi:hypothetical protein
MKDVSFEHVFECDEDTYWDKIFFDEAYNRALFLETLKFNLWRQTIQQQGDTVVKRTVEVQPPVGEVAAPVRKALGDRFGYKEFGTFDRKTKRYHVDVTPSAGADRTKIHGDIWLEKAGERRVKRVAKMHVEVNIMLIGKLIEERVVGDMTLSYGKAAEFTNRWIKDKGL